MPATRPDTWSDMRTRCAIRPEPLSEPAPHRPRAAVLTCSDARISPARLFDLPEGSLFVVRVAGNVASAEAVASLAYAVDQLGVDTVVVLGHSHCGAVGAALDGVEDPALACLTDPIRAALDGGPCAELTCAVSRNVESSLATIRRDAGTLGKAVRDGRVALHGAVVDLTTSALVDVPSSPIPTRPTSDPVQQPQETPT